MAYHLISPKLPTAWTTPHLAMSPDYPTKNQRLVVYLPGTHGQPTEASQFAATVTGLGYHYLALSYANDRAITEICDGYPLTCPLNVRREIVYGGQASGLITVYQHDGIVGRLTYALEKLIVGYPLEGWQNYLAQGTPTWEYIIVAGHSQGAGHAVLIAKEQLVSRVLLFSGCGESWQTEGVVLTPANRFWGFIALQGPVSVDVRCGWQSLGIPGDELVIGKASSPYNSQRLVTDIAPAAVGCRHWQTVVDRCLPPGGYREVWQAMLAGE